MRKKDLCVYSASSFEMPLCPQSLDKLGKFAWLSLDSVNPAKHGHTKLFYLTTHFKTPPMATPISTPNFNEEKCSFTVFTL